MIKTVVTELKVIILKSSRMIILIRKVSKIDGCPKEEGP